jgi:hypothetical protein
MLRRRLLFILGAFAAVFLSLLIVDFIARERMKQDRVYSLNNLRELSLFAQMAATPADWQPIGPGKATEAERLKSVDIPVAIFPGTIPNASLKPNERLSWIVRALPYLNHQRQDFSGLIRRIDVKSPWDAMENLGAANTVVRALIPTSLTVPQSAGPAPTYYVALGGIGPGDAAILPANHPLAGCVRYDRDTPFAAIGDGLRESILFAETASNLSPWIAGGPGTVRTVGEGTPLGWAAEFGGIHRGYSCFGYADGSAGILTDRISPAVFRALVTINGRDTLIGE